MPLDRTILLGIAGLISGCVFAGLDGSYVLPLDHPATRNLVGSRRVERIALDTDDTTALLEADKFKSVEEANASLSAKLLSPPESK